MTARNLWGARWCLRCTKCWPTNQALAWWSLPRVWLVQVRLQNLQTAQLEAAAYLAVLALVGQCRRVIALQEKQQQSPDQLRHAPVHSQVHAAGGQGSGAHNKCQVRSLPACAACALGGFQAAGQCGGQLHNQRTHNFASDCARRFQPRRSLFPRPQDGSCATR